MHPTITVNISPAGDIKVEAAGVKGSGCQALTRAIEQALGSTTTDQHKPEFYQQQTNTAKAGNGKGLGR